MFLFRSRGYTGFSFVTMIGLSPRKLCLSGKLMAPQYPKKPAPLVSFVVDEATEFMLKAEPNVQATVKQRSGNAESDRRILTIEADDVTEFTVSALPPSAGKMPPEHKQGTETDPVA